MKKKWKKLNYIRDYLPIFCLVSSRLHLKLSHPANDWVNTDCCCLLFDWLEMRREEEWLVRGKTGRRTGGNWSGPGSSPLCAQMTTGWRKYISCVNMVFGLQCSALLRPDSIPSWIVSPVRPQCSVVAWFQLMLTATQTSDKNWISCRSQMTNTVLGRYRMHLSII